MLVIQQSLSSATAHNAYSPPDSLDPGLLVALATTGLFPITLGFACISYWGRHSCYLIVLSCTTFLLATITFAFAYSGNESIFPLGESGSLDRYVDEVSAGICPIRLPLSEVLLPICGSMALANNYLPTSAVRNKITWLPWCCCFIVLIATAFGHRVLDAIHQIGRVQKYSGTIRPRRSVVWLRDRVYPVVKNLAKFAVFFVVCSIFTHQALLFYIYIEHDLISPEWSFGQVIAVTVWVPSIMEFLYIELGMIFLIGL